MVILAVVLLFGWAALTGGFGAYALMAAFQSESLLHVVQAGISLLIATVAASAGFLALILGRLKSNGAHVTSAAVTHAEPERPAAPAGRDAEPHGVGQS